MLLRRLLFAFLIVVLSAAVIGAGMSVGMLRQVEQALTITPLENHRALSGLIQNLSQLSSRLDALHVHPSPSRQIDASVAADTAYAMAGLYRQRYLKEYTGSNRAVLSAALDEVDWILKAVTGLLESPNGIDPQFALALATRMGDVSVTLTDTYLRANTEALSQIHAKSERIGELRRALMGMLGLILLSVAGLIVLAVLQVRTQAALRASDQRYRDLADGSLQGILIDRAGKPLVVNESYARIFGYAHSADILALDILDPLYAEGEQARLRGYREAREQGEAAPVRYEFQGRRQDGGVIWLENHVRRITWDGAPASQSTLIDITERKRAEEDLREAKITAETALADLKATQKSLI